MPTARSNWVRAAVVAPIRAYVRATRKIDSGSGFRGASSSRSRSAILEPAFEHERQDRLERSHERIPNSCGRRACRGDQRRRHARATPAGVRRKSRRIPRSPARIRRASKRSGERSSRREDRAGARECRSNRCVEQSTVTACMDQPGIELPIGATLSRPANQTQDGGLCAARVGLDGRVPSGTPAASQDSARTPFGTTPRRA